ncbi:altronate dehydratase family protein [Sphingomonas donggukensis]|uniref:Altronate dehydratase family protein n=1 Tax=Sphingomonas donggukensis TaxID=2949093 RepID=A0ABY4TUE3_9SPHN|nr:altronate dehydratase family protein [Sphingomonas donggukensis]URW76025.1 altronate dehydratase family protein [Sphingomonas donggukensis]
MAGERVFQVDPGDDVATALGALEPGEAIDGLVVRDAVPVGHKIAVRAVAAGAPVIKFGFPIGRATRDIAVGEHVHVHNVATALCTHGDYRYVPQAASMATPPAPREFLGYRRADGCVATRNEVWVIPTVGCVARTAQKIAARGDALHGGRIDGIHALVHPFGCSQLGDDLDGTTAILAALAQHPNAAGVVLVGLGCESNQLDRLVAMIDPALRDRIRTVRAQSATDEVAEGVAHVAELVALAETVERTAVPLSELVLGVKCGGSDGFSGLTANPLVGRMSDAVTAAGGTAILTEIPEIFGAEQMLMDRAADADVFAGLVAMVNGFKRYFVDAGQPVSENPSPGNIAGGITTLEEKSLGAVQKAGHATVTDVRRYGERVRRRGLTLLEAPGNDAVSCTALAAAGATAILFTTGRGTPLGFPVPTIKIASNTALAERKPGWIDFDAGQALEDADGAATGLLDRVIAIASGEATAAERNDEREIAIWKRGVTL